MITIMTAQYKIIVFTVVPEALGSKALYNMYLQGCCNPYYDKNLVSVLIRPIERNLETAASYDFLNCCLIKNI